MSDVRPWTCPTCNAVGDDAVLPALRRSARVAPGLHAARPRERLIEAFTSVDTRTVRSACVSPAPSGRLTLAWMKGVRKTYVAPITLFLLINVVFFAVQSLTGETVFSSSLDSHLHHQDWSGYAQSRVTEKLEETGVPLSDYAPVFDLAVVVNAKSLIILMTAPFAAAPAARLPARAPAVHDACRVRRCTSTVFCCLLFCVRPARGRN